MKEEWLREHSEKYLEVCYMSIYIVYDINADGHHQTLPREHPG